MLTTIHALVLDGRGGCRRATADEASLGRADGLLWLHLDYAAEGVQPWLHAASGLDEVTVEALTTAVPRPRLVPVGEGMLLVLRGVNINQGAQPEDMVSLRLWVEGHRVISLRHRRVAAVQDVVDLLEQGVGPTDAGDLLHDVADRLLTRIEALVAGVEDTADALEEEVLSAEGRALRTRLSDLRRSAIALRRYVAPQRETLARLHTERAPWLTDLARARLREDADRVTRVMESLDSARERAAVTYEELGNRLAEQMNQTMYLLSLVTAVFLPLGLVTGLLGVNVGGVPGAEWGWAFWLLSAGLVVLGVLEWGWVKRRWLR